MLTRLMQKFSAAKPSAPAGGAGPPPAAEQLPESTARPSWQPGDIIVGRYRVEQVLSGAMGDIYIAEHLGWHIKMAIKSPKPEVLADREGLKRILTEAQSWVRLGLHPNIATCYYVLNLYKVPHIFIEFIDGGTLADWLKTGRCKDLRTALSLAIQFCHGMEYTHAQGIVHRDIKPQNILITKNALVKITDFGILQTRPQEGDPLPIPAALDPSDPGEETTVGFRGTPAYASPEQFRNTHRVDLRTDIFSFGICLWLILCGRKPYKNNLVPEELDPQALDPQTPLTPIMVEILKKSVAHQPEERYQNFSELRLALNQAYQSYFKVDCPYLTLDGIDLQAENCNNRAVSLLELGKAEEALKHLGRALELNDIFPEALHNLLLCKWRQGKSSPSRLLRQLEAIKPRVKNNEILDSLAAALKERLQQSGKTGAGPDGNAKAYPEYRLSPPKKSLEIFREGQLHQSVQRNISNLLTNKRYGSCHNVLMQAWGNNGFRKDAIFADAYDRLLQVGNKKGLAGVQRLLTLHGPGTPVADLAYLPGSRKIFSTDSRGKLFIRDFGPKPGISVVDKQIVVRTMAISGDGAYLALGDGEGKVSVWSVKSGKITSSFAQVGAIQALAFSADGQRLASGSAGGMVKIKAIASGQEQTILSKEGGAIQALAFFPGGHDLVTGSEDGTLRFWNAGAREPLRIVEAHALPITSLTAASNGLFFVSGSSDRYLKLWDRQTGQCLDSIEAHQDAITSLLILADNRHIVSSCEDDIIKIWDAQSRKCLQTLDGRGDGIRVLGQGPKPHIFLAGRQDGAVVFWMAIYNLEFDF